MSTVRKQGFRPRNDFKIRKKALIFGLILLFGILYVLKRTGSDTENVGWQRKNQKDSLQLYQSLDPGTILSLISSPSRCTTISVSLPTFKAAIASV